MPKKKLVPPKPAKVKKAAKKAVVKAPVSVDGVKRIDADRPPCGGCLHKASDHYGKAKPWCNVQFCDCQDYVSVN